MNIGDIIYNKRKELGLTLEQVGNAVGVSKSTVKKWETGYIANIKRDKIAKLADVLQLNPVTLINGDLEADTKFNSPTITEDTVTYPVIGEVAAGYDKIAIEDWDGDTIEIPTEYLRGRAPDEFFVLRVKGDSMYPIYMDGDKVLVLKQSTLDHSGDIGVMIYDGECGTLKKVEYVMGEDWLKMIPLNPNYQPVKIEGEDLERCRVLGVPRLLIREIEQ